MRNFFASLFAFFACMSGMAKNNPSLEYEILISQPHTHYAHVKITLRQVQEKTLHFKMPVWTPGSYLVREFSRNVESVTAAVNGKLVSAVHLDKNTWQVAAGKGSTVVFEYDLYAFEFSVRTSFIDASHAFLHNTSVFMYVEEFQHLPGKLRLNYSANWKKIATSLEADDETNVYHFQHYDDLADSPIEIGNHTEIKFTLRGVPHLIAMVGTHNADTAKFKQDLKKMCETMTAIVDTHPCKKYVFIVQNTESGGGGLEHLNSCCVVMNRWTWTDPEKYRNFLGLCAHEYFHLWNVKRIRPIELGPFNYSAENYTRQLWVAEGITSYYDELALLRAGLMDTAEYLETLSDNITALENRPGSKIQTLAESSMDAWIKEYRPNENSKNTSISYYAKGSVVAALLDVKICTSTHGTKNLDDLMRLLYQRFYLGKKRGFTEAEFISAASEIAGENLQAFFDLHVYSTQQPLYAEILQAAGLTLKEKVSENTELGITTALENGKTIVKYELRNSTAWMGGLNVNDEIISINGTRINNDAEAVLKQLGQPETVQILISRGGLISMIAINRKDFRLEKVKFTVSAPAEKKWSPALQKWLGAHP